MTDSAIQALIDAARTGTNDLVTWAELKAILEGLKSQTSLTDLGTPTEGQVPKYVSGSWALGADETAAAGSGWDSSATLTANRTVTQNNYGFTFRKTTDDTTPNITIDNDYTNDGQYFFVNTSPSKTTSGRKWEWRRDSTLNTDGSYNEVMKWGFNIDRQGEPTKNGMWYAIEPHWISGSALYHEFHLSMNITGEPGEKRIFSHTFINRGTYALSDGVWDFRCNRFHVKYWNDNDIFVVSSPTGGGSMKMQISSPNNTAIFYAETNGSNNILYWSSPGASARWEFLNSIGEINFNSVVLRTTLPTYASDAAAGGGGLTAGALYKTSTGEVRVKL